MVGEEKRCDVSNFSEYLSEGHSRNAPRLEIEVYPCSSFLLALLTKVRSNPLS